MIFAPQKIRMIKIEDIRPNPYQVRRNFNAKSLKNLAFSIKEVGVLSPILVRAAVSGYEIVLGERRVRAAQMAGLKTVPSIVADVGDRECALLSMVENLHREDLSAFEEGEGYFNLISYHRLKKDSILKKLAVKGGRINEKLRLLAIPAPIRYKIEENNIEETTARELLKLHNDEKQAEIIEEIAREGLNRKQAAILVRNTLHEMAVSSTAGKTRKREQSKTPLYINTIIETVDLLKRNGAKTQLERLDTENSIEFTIKIAK